MKSQRLKNLISLWPFLLIPAALIYVYVTVGLGLSKLSEKTINETIAFPLVGLSVVSFFWLACKTGNELVTAMTLLTAAFFCREWHFAGTDAGIYIVIVIFTGWFVYRRQKIEAMIRGKKINIWLFATASCYLFSQIMARRVFSKDHLGLLPMEDTYFVSFEETSETTAHLMMLITSIVAWFTFYFNEINAGVIRIKEAVQKSVNRMKPALSILFALVIAGGSIGWYKSRPYHFKTVRPGVLYRSGWMDADDMDAVIQKYGIRTVVNLCLPGESTYRENHKDEKTVCRKHHVQIVSIPMPGNTPPTPDQIEQWLSLLEDSRQWPILVHCAQGATRTAVMVAVCQMEFLGKDNRETLDNLETFGHKLTDPKRKRIYNFISNYEPTL